MDEVGALVVRLTGDGDEYKRMLQEAQAATKRTEEAIISVGNHIDGFGDQLSRWGELAVSALALHTLKQFLGESLSAWQETEDNAIKLNAILRANGRDVEALTERYNDFAAGIQRLSTTSDDATIALVAQAESFGLTGAAAEEAVRNAMGFAAMNDGNAESYLRFTAAMARGDTEMMKRFARMIPQLRGITDETELVRRAHLLAATGFETAERQAATLSGRLTQLENAWGDIMESVGETVAKALKPVVELVRFGVDFLQSFSAEAKEAATSGLLIVAALASIGPGIATARATIIPLMTMMDDGFRLAARAIMTCINPLNLLKGALIGVQFAAVNIKKAVAFMFGPWGIAIAAIATVIGVVIDYLGGFAETWNYIKAVAMAAWDIIKETIAGFIEWLRPIGRAAMGVFSAVWEVIKAAVFAVWGVIRSVFSMIWDYITSIWESIFGRTEIDWTKIRDVIIDSLIAVEFGIRNFRQVWGMALAWIRLKVEEFTTTIRYNFTQVLPAALRWLRDNWDRIITGEQAEFRVMPRLTTRAENELRREFEAVRDTLVESWEAFRERRRQEIFAVEQNEEANRGAIPRQMEQDRRAVEAETKKMEAALRWSAEGIARILRHQEMVRGGPRPAPSNAAPAIASSSTSTAAARSADNERRQLSLMERIEEHLRAMRNQPGTPLTPAELI